MKDKNCFQNIGVAVKQECVSDNEDDIPNENIDFGKDSGSIKEETTDLNQSVRKSERGSRTPAKFRESEKRKSSVSTNKKSKRPRKSPTLIDDDEEEMAEDPNSVSETCKQEKGESLSNMFYKELETLPTIKHYSGTLINENITIENDNDGTVKPVVNIDIDGYSLALDAYFCKDCEYTFPEQKYFAGHKRKGKCIFPCEYCKEQFSFRNFSEYQEHLKTHR